MTTLSSLQALNAVCSSVKSFLGPQQRMVCVIEDEAEDSQLVSSCCQLLNSLSVQHPVGCLAIEACHSHYKAHGTGATTLMTMAGAWATEMQMLLDQGIPLSAIISYGDVCIEQCLAALETIALTCSYRTTSDESEHFEHPIPASPTSPNICSRLEGINTPRYYVQDDKVLSHQSDMDVDLTAGQIRSDCACGSSQMIGDVGEKDIDDISWFFQEEEDSCSQSPKHHQLDWKHLKSFGGNSDSESDELERDSDVLRKEPKIHPSKNDISFDHSDDEFDDCISMNDTCQLLQEAERLKEYIPGNVEPKHEDDFNACFSDQKQATSVEDPSNSPIDDITVKSEGCRGAPNQEESGDEFDSCFPVMPTRNVDFKDSSNILENLMKACSTKDTFQATIRTEKQDNLNTNVQNHRRHVGSIKMIPNLEKPERKHLGYGHRTSQRSHTNRNLLQEQSFEKDVEVLQTNADPQHSDTSLNASVQIPGASQQWLKIEDAIKKFAQSRLNATAAKRLAAIRNSSRHFRTNESVVAHSDSSVQDTGIPSAFHKELSHQVPRLESGFQTLGGGHCPIDDCHRLIGEKEIPRNSREKRDVVQQIDLAQLGIGLSHGADVEMGLVVEAARRQSEHFRVKEGSNMRCFNLMGVNVCPIGGTSISQSRIEPGILLIAGRYQLAPIATLEGAVHKALLVNGDATPNYRHTGYTNKVRVTAVSSRVLPPEDGQWLQNVMQLIQELNIRILLVKGRSDQRLLDHCLSKTILLLQDVPYPILHTISQALGAPMVTYLCDATSGDLVCGVTVTRWVAGWLGRAEENGVRQQVYAKVDVEGLLLQTAVLCSTVSSLLRASEIRFKKCCHRLQDVLNTGRVLPGAGVPEQAAIKQLGEISTFNELSINESDRLHCYNQPIRTAFTNGLVKYLTVVMTNLGYAREPTTVKTLVMTTLTNDRLEPVLSGFSNRKIDEDRLLVYDSLTIKRAAWENAWSLVKLALRIDAQVVTGLHESTQTGLEGGCFL